MAARGRSRRGPARRIRPASRRRSAPLLGLAAARLLAPTSYVFADQEDERLGFAIGQALTRGELSEAQAVRWLEPIAAKLGASRPGPVPASVSNTVRTLRVVYLIADRGVRPQSRLSVPLKTPALLIEQRYVRAMDFPSWSLPVTM
ncbi:MAG TPA: DUF2785 domain-containing protein [Streptosporangiaceae bacterium]|nr:DUF2785 domain-containing protein [Streptosporangiaceae bacterium]